MNEWCDHVSEQRPDGQDQTEFEQVPDQSEQLDQDPFQPDYGLTDRGVDDALDEGLTVPERWSALERQGEHETLDQRLAEELPDDTAGGKGARTDPETGPEPGQDTDLDTGRDAGHDLDEPIEAESTDGEVGQRRAGRLVDPDAGIGEDHESELVGRDVGIDGAAAGAEEAAVHVVDDQDPDIEPGPDAEQDQR